jgi:hypothetical protein
MVSDSGAAVSSAGVEAGALACADELFAGMGTLGLLAEHPETSNAVAASATIRIR